MYQRILLKLSGEALGGNVKSGLDGSSCERIAQEISIVHQSGVRIGIVIGGGNFFRGAKASGLNLARSQADQIGMLATVMNGIALSQALLNFSVPTRVMSSIPCGTFVEPYSCQEAMKALEEGTVVIFVGGMGHPYFTTDTTAALRAAEIKADVLLKATTVDGIYDCDPKECADAVRFKQISYSDVLGRELQVMDLAAIALCKENGIPIRVFDLFMLKRAVEKEEIGTLVEGS